MYTDEWCYIKNIKNDPRRPACRAIERFDSKPVLADRGGHNDCRFQSNLFENDYVTLFCQYKVYIMVSGCLYLVFVWYYRTVAMQLTLLALPRYNICTVIKTWYNRNFIQHFASSMSTISSSTADSARLPAIINGHFIRKLEKQGTRFRLHYLTYFY